MPVRRGARWQTWHAYPQAGELVLDLERGESAMSLRNKLLVAGAIGGVGLIVLLFAIFGGGGVRGLPRRQLPPPVRERQLDRVHLDGEAEGGVRADPLPPGRRPTRSSTRPGYFLRYSDDIVAITANGTGSRIYVDDERRGYSHWLFFVGGVWGTGGSGENFRGGGPGGGK